ncbi:MAG: diaminopimelate decarboxylase, partial [Bradymonadia bacterium]
MNPRSPIEDVARVLSLARDAGAWDESSRSAIFHDLDRLEGRLHELISAFPADTMHGVAVKANPLVELLRV